MDGWNTTYLLGWPIFRCYVSLPEGKLSENCILNCFKDTKEIHVSLTFWKQHGVRFHINKIKYMMPAFHPPNLEWLSSLKIHGPFFQVQLPACAHKVSWDEGGRPTLGGHGPESRRKSWEQRNSQTVNFTARWSVYILYMYIWKL